jgi:hypothetical protein
VFCAFGVSWSVWLLVRTWGRWRSLGLAALGALAAGTVAILVFAPWGVNTFQALIPEAGRYLIQEGSQSDFHRNVYNAFPPLQIYVPTALLILSAAGLLLHTLRRRFDAWVIVLWVLVVLVLTNPYVLGLPGAGIITNFAVFILLYMPASLLSGLLLGEIVDWLGCREWPERVQRALAVVVVGVVVLGGVWGTTERAKVLDRGFALVTPADAAAMEWIRANVSPDAKFLINGFAAYEGSVVVGADAGWWLPVLARRDNTIPPLSYTSELLSDPGLRQQMPDDLAAMQGATLTEMAALLDEREITHVYIGRGQGRVGNPGQPLLDSKAVPDDPACDLVYDLRGVQICERIAVGR